MGCKRAIAVRGCSCQVVQQPSTISIDAAIPIEPTPAIPPTFSPFDEPENEETQHEGEQENQGEDEEDDEDQTEQLINLNVDMANQCARIGMVIVESPMPPLWHRVPPQLERRVCLLLQEALALHAEAENVACQHPGASNDAYAYTLGIFLYTCYACIMYKPIISPDAETPAQGENGIYHQKQAKEGDAEANLRVVNTIRYRLKMAELGQWLTLMQDLRTAQEQANAVALAEHRGNLSNDGEAELRRHQKSVNKMLAGDIAGSRNALQPQPTIAGGDEYVAQITEMIATEIDQAEQIRFAKAVAKSKKFAKLHKFQPSSELVRSMLWKVNTHAEPGPSGIPNRILKKMYTIRGGIATLQRWIGMWASGLISPCTSALWNQSKIATLDCGPKEDARTGRKLRPIALSESLVKFAESCIIQHTIKEIQANMEPGNLGIATNGGALILQQIVEGYADDIENRNVMAEMNGEHGELWGVEAADLTNAYGTFLRSYAVDQTIKMYPQLAGVVYATEQCMSTTYLLRNQGRWIPIYSRRGGAQGRRLTTIMFGCWLYRTHKEAQTSEAPDVTHSAYQDDTYRVGPLKQLAASWQPWHDAITKMGGQVNLKKSEVWLPGCDQTMIDEIKGHYPSYDLPFVVDGLEMLGSVLQERNKTYIGNMEKKISKVAERLKKRLQTMPA